MSSKVLNIIAEIGNNHFGNILSAKEHIRIAKLSGADQVKMQAFKARDVKGSMSFEFYNQCAFSEDQCLELVEFAKSQCDITLFFSIFSKGFDTLARTQKLNKISANQNFNGSNPYPLIDEWSTIVSFGKTTKMYPLEFAQIVYATEYMPKKIDITYITKLKEFYKRRVGLSDHHVGIAACLYASQAYQIHIIEKHFTLEKEKKFNGKTFRDTVHGMDAQELETLARLVK